MLLKRVSTVILAVLFVGVLWAGKKEKEHALTLQQRVEQLEQHSAEVDQYLMLVETRLWDLHDRLETIEQAKHTAQATQGWTSTGGGAVHTQ